MPTSYVRRTLIFCATTFLKGFTSARKPSVIRATAFLGTFTSTGKGRFFPATTFLRTLAYASNGDGSSEEDDLRRKGLRLELRHEGIEFENFSNALLRTLRLVT